MPRRLTPREFIEKAQKTHGDKFDYSFTEYINGTSKVNILCDIHGIFMQNPMDHLSGSGCPECAPNKKLNKGEFIKRARKIHGDKFDYSLVNYKTTSAKVEIICHTHGSFLQVASSHMNGFGCSKCSGKSKMTRDTFLKLSNSQHNNKYNYFKTEFTHRSSGKVIITCNKHGDFLQTPDAHINGQGCMKCSREKSNFNRLKLYQNNQELGSQPGIYYELKFRHKELNFEFLKVGITSQGIIKRYRGYTDYEYEILKEIHTTNLESAILENEYLKTYKDNKFKFPKNIHFRGRTECFNI